MAHQLWATGNDAGYPLTAEDRAMLAVIATIARYRKGDTIYREGASANYVFNLITGLVKSCMSLPGKGQHVVGFLFPGDLIGLADEGKYVNSAEAVTAVTLYKLPVAALEARLRRNPNLDFHVICKLCHDLREAQRHAYFLSKHHAIAKLGLFLQMIETHQAAFGQAAGEVYLPMTRGDIGAYVGLSPEAVTRSLRELVNRRAISMRDRRHVKLIDRARLEATISEFRAPAAVGRRYAAD